MLWFIQVFGHPPNFYILRSAEGLEVFCAFIIAWLLKQPIVGAIAAWWSRRAGGVMRHQLLAALSPAIALLAVFVLILPWAMVVDRQVSHNVRMTAFLLLTVTWVLLPSPPLLLGTAPFLRTGQAQA